MSVCLYMYVYIYTITNRVFLGTYCVTSNVFEFGFVGSEERYTFSVTESIWPSSLYSVSWCARLGSNVNFIKCITL